jgi:hypothetical protein
MRPPARRRRARICGGEVLGVDVDPQVGPRPEHVLEQWYGLVTHPGPPHLGVGKRPHVARPVRHPVEGVVVEGDEDTVGRGVDVGLDVPVAQVDGGGEGGHGVLRGLSGAAAVGDGNGAGPVEEGPVAGRTHAGGGRNVEGAPAA